jgi:hypothetical protein
MRFRNLLAFLFVGIFMIGFSGGALESGINYGFVNTTPTLDPEGSTENIVLDIAVAIRATAPENATITEIGWWCSNTHTNTNFEVGLYEHSNSSDEPTSLIIGEDRTNPTNGSIGWKNSSGLNISIIAGETYWIVVQVDDNGTSPGMDYEAKVGEKRHYDFTNTLTNPFDPTDGGSTAVRAIYALYEVQESTPTAKSLQLSSGNKLQLGENGRFSIHG